MTAAHLLTLAQQPLTIHLIDPRTDHGVAYGTTDPDHLLNVPAKGMSAWPDNPDDFVNWAATTLNQPSPTAFHPRAHYRDYLHTTLNAAEQAAHPGVTLARHTAQATSLDAQGLLTLSDGATLPTNLAILATGFGAPACPPPLDALGESTRLIRDPWRAGALDPIQPGERVLLIGSGLTAMDVALTCARRGATTLAVSRRGLTPHRHQDLTPLPTLNFDPQSILDQPTLMHRLRTLRRACRDAHSAGGDWRQVIDALRPINTALWSTLTPNDQQRFIRRLAVYWDVHRHRASQTTASKVDALCAAGTFEHRKATVVQASVAADGVSVTLADRDHNTTQRFDRIILCTGPSTDPTRATAPLLRSLVEQGRLTKDPAGLGIHIDADHHPISADGTADQQLLVVGPALRGRYWESTAVPELRIHALHTAQHALKALTR